MPSIITRPSTNRLAPRAAARSSPSTVGRCARVALHRRLAYSYARGSGQRPDRHGRLPRGEPADLPAPPRLHGGPRTAEHAGTTSTAHTGEKGSTPVLITGKEGPGRVRGELDRGPDHGAGTQQTYHREVALALISRAPDQRLRLIMPQTLQDGVTFPADTPLQAPPRQCHRSVGGVYVPLQCELFLATARRSRRPYRLNGPGPRRQGDTLSVTIFWSRDRRACTMWLSCRWHTGKTCG